MDYFDLESINKYIREDKNKYRKQLEAITLGKKLTQNSYDLLLTNLDYSPKNEKINSEEDFINYYIPNKEKIKIEPSRYQKALGMKNKGEEVKEKPTEIIGRKISVETMEEDFKRTIAKNILEEILIKVFERLEEKEKEPEIEDESDSDDEYERMVAMRQRDINQRAQTNNNMGNDNKKNIPTTSGGTVYSKFWNNYKDANNVIMYLFNTKKTITISISGTDTIKDLIKYTIDDIIKNKQVELKYEDYDGFELTLVDEDEGLPNTDFGGLDTSLNISQAKNKFLAIIYKKDYTPSTPKKRPSFLEDSKDLKGGNKCVVKVYYKIKGAENTYKCLTVNPEDNLTSITQGLLGKEANMLPVRNVEMYYYSYHQTDDKNEKIEAENALPNDLLIKDLVNRELDIFLNKFSDMADKLEESIDESMKSQEIEKVGNEYIFNEISAGKLQEWEVVKINKFQHRNERVLGIDMYNIYNGLPKNEAGGGFIGKIFNKKSTKTPQRKIKDIIECQICGDKMFYFTFKETKDKKEEIRKSTFEVKNNNIRNEIVAKLQFLIKLNHEA